MTRTVVIEDSAKGDIRRIAAYIRLHVSRKSSDRWVNQIQAAMASLKERAEQWPFADDPGLHDTGIRVKLSGRRPLFAGIPALSRSTGLGENLVRHCMFTVYCSRFNTIS